MINLGLPCILLIVSVGLSSAYVGHGEVCDQTSSATSCNPSSDLRCNDDAICECAILADMEYDEDTSRCVVLHGGNCLRPTGGNFRCVTDAYCEYNSKECLCNYQRSPSADRHCARSHGAFCNATLACNSLDLIVCRFENCRCPLPMDHYFKEQRYNRCFIKVGASCTPGADPREEVGCDPDETACAADPESASGYSCQCLPDLHLQHYERRCVRGHLQTCNNGTDDTDPPCDVVGGLACHEEVCQCRLAPDQVWDEEQKACVSTEGKGCNIADETVHYLELEYFFKCFTGLECVPINNDHEFEGICRKAEEPRHKI